MRQIDGHEVRHRVLVRRDVREEPLQASPAQRTRWPLYALTCSVGLCIVTYVAWLCRPNLLIEAPAFALLFAALIGAIAGACGGQEYVHRRFSSHDFVQHNEVGGFIIAIAGTLYSVLLGFLTVVGWDHFSDARQVVALEAAAATDVWHAAVGIPSPVRTRVRRDALQYAQSMVANEWPKMRSGHFDRQADYILMDAMTAASTFIPSNQGESNSQSATLAQLSILHDERQRRLAENESSMSGFEWLVLLLGAGCIISFCWLFGLSNQRVHLLMTSSVAFLMTSVLVLLFELQYPFRTDLRIAPDSWKAAVNHIYMMQSGPQPGMRM